MQFFTPLAILLAATSTFASTFVPDPKELKVGDWAPATKTDVRSPCPALNTLANHGYLNRSGKNLTTDAVLKAITDKIGFSPALAKFIVDFVVSRKFSNFTDGFFTLKELHNHNVGLERDTSMTRGDLHFGDNYSFNKTLFNQMISFSSDGKVLTIPEISKHRQARIADSRARNPEFSFTPAEQSGANTDAALAMCVLGDCRKNMTVKLPYLKAFFEDERFPIEEGWTKHVPFVEKEQLDEVEDAIALLANANVTTTEPHKKNDDTETVSGSYTSLAKSGNKTEHNHHGNSTSVHSSSKTNTDNKEDSSNAATKAPAIIFILASSIIFAFMST